MNKIILVLIKWYQIFSRFFISPTCKYYPTCSEYSKQCFEKFSFFKAFMKSFTRILRCNPLFKGGYDPVNK